MTRAELERLVRQNARKYGVPVDLARAVVGAESNWNPAAVSHAGAQGLMQLMPGTARDLGVVNPFDPAQNVSGGMRHLARLLQKYGDQRLALAAYNIGEGRVGPPGQAQIPNITETRDYVEKIMAGLPQTIPASAFPQFDPMSMAQGMTPVSAVQNAVARMQAGLLGNRAQPLLGPTQPAGLLDRFAPGSGYGYDVALGIAGTPGGPLTSLAGGMAHAKDQAFERQLTAAQGKTSGMPAKTQEVLNLMAMGVPQDRAFRMAYPGGTETGTVYKDVGGVTYEITTLPGGEVTTRQLSNEEAARRLGVLETESAAETTGTEEAKQRVQNREAFRNAYMKVRNTVPGELAKLRQLRDEFRGGAYGTGFLEGALKERFDTALQVLNYEAIGQVLNVLDQVTTGGLSEQELKIFMQGAIGTHNTVEANLAILDDMIRIAEDKMASATQFGAKFNEPGFDPLRWIPPMPEVPSLPPRFGTGAPSPPTVTPAAPNAPGATEGSQNIPPPPDGFIVR